MSPEIARNADIGFFTKSSKKHLHAEDAEDLAAFDERVDEPLVSYDQMIKRLKKDCRI